MHPPHGLGFGSENSRSAANQSMIVARLQLPSFSSACRATASSCGDGWKPKSWYCGVLRYQLNVLRERAQRQLCDSLAIHLEALARRCPPAEIVKEKPSLKGRTYRVRHWIEINRAPALTLLATVVAVCLGFD
jgi:hypothetical protein